MDDDPPIFEKTYPKYEFSELVRVAIALAAWFARLRRQAEVTRPAPPPAPTAGKELHAD